MAHRVMESQGGTPVVNNHGNILKVHFLNETLDKLHMVKEGMLDIRLVRLAHPDKVRGYCTPQRGHIGEDVTPQV